MTEFKEVPGYPEYRVSKDGQIQSRWRRGNSKTPKSAEWNSLKCRKDEKGYLTVALCDGVSKPKTFRLHRIIAITYLGYPPKNACVRHLDGNPENNMLENLAYGTYAENENDKRRHGTWVLRCSGATLNLDKANEIRAHYAAGESQKSLAERYSVSRPTITRVINGTIWRQSCE